MLRFLADETMGLNVVRVLREEGWDMESVIEIKPGMNDKNVLALGCQKNRILITNDKDFGKLIFRRKFRHKGVIFLRLKKDNVRNRIQVLKALLQERGDQLSNRFVTVTEGKLRIRESF